jgi:hypothetical protein
MTIEESAKRLLLADGWSLAGGPFLNAGLLQHGLHVVSIKSVMSKPELEARGIKWDKSNPPGSQRTVRFLCNVTLDGETTEIRHITSSQRKRLGKMCRRSKRKTKNVAESG